jgi:acyl-CoA thioester hydrolase
VSRIEIDYKHSLKSDDRFIVKVNTLKEGHLRMIFEQDIFKVPDNKHVVHAKVTGVGLKNGRPTKVEDIPGIKDLKFD